MTSHVTTNSHITTSTSAESRTESGSVRARLCGLQQRAAVKAQPFFLLATRALFGYALFLAGKGKLGNLDAVAGFFGQLGIPAAKAMAVTVGSIEMFGGLLLIAGLASRMVAMLLTGVLAVALLTAHWAQLAVVFSDPGSFLTAAPVPYLMAVLLIALVGPGRFAVDELMARRARER